MCAIFSISHWMHDKVRGMAFWIPEHILDTGSCDAEWPANEVEEWRVCWTEAIFICSLCPVQCRLVSACFTQARVLLVVESVWASWSVVDGSRLHINTEHCIPHYQYKCGPGARGSLRFTWGDPKNLQSMVSVEHVEEVAQTSSSVYHSPIQPDTALTFQKAPHGYDI